MFGTSLDSLDEQLSMRRQQQRRRLATWAVAAAVFAAVITPSGAAVADDSGSNATPVGGGGAYPSSSPYYALAQYSDMYGNDDLVVRKGNSDFGYAHYATKHGLPGLDIIGETIEKGSRERFNSQYGYTDVYDYTIHVYNTNLYKETGDKSYTSVLVAVAMYPIENDNAPIGVLTAFCPSAPNELCPSYIGYGPWSYGGRGA